MATLEKKDLDELVNEVISKIRDYIYNGEVNTKTSRRAELKEIISKIADKNNENINN